MKISLNWIKDYVCLPDQITPQQMLHDLTMSTVEVEDVIDAFPAADFANLVIGKVESVQPSANASHLAIVQARVGKSESVTVACGASNVKQGMKVVVALPGARVRMGKAGGEQTMVEIQPVERAGITSRGMLCSAREIGLEKLFRNLGEKEILDLSSFAGEPGDDVRKVLGLDDPIFVIDNKSLTHRPDLWGHWGIARELSAIYRVPMKPVQTFDLTKLSKVEQKICMVAEASRFMCFQVEGVSAIETPYAMRSRLVKVDQDTHNLLVDITNYVMLAVGQPCHAFDRKTLDGPLQVRFAKQNETIRLIGGADFQCASTDLVVADQKKAVALAGIKGGHDTSVTTETRELTLEFANFDSACIRQTSKARNTASGEGGEKIRSEASSRFEKSLDPELTETAAKLCLALLTEAQPTTKILSYSDDYPRKPTIKPIEVSIDFLHWRVGMKHSLAEIKGYLNPLGFAVQEAGGKLTITPPTWRATGDIKYPEDIVEEIARLCGYEKLDFVPLETHFSASVNQSWARLEKKLAEHLAFSCNMHEIFSYPWADEKYLKAAKVDLAKCLSLSSPPSPNERFVQPSLVPQMLSATATNLRYFSEFRLFQIGKVFQRSQASNPSQSVTSVQQTKMLASILVGQNAFSLFREAKGVMESLGRVLQIPSLTFSPSETVPWAQKGLSLDIHFAGKRIGCMGVVSKDAKFLAGIKNAQLVCVEISIEELTSATTSNRQYAAPPVLPVIESVISVVVDEEIAWSRIADSIASTKYSVAVEDANAKVAKVVVASPTAKDEDRVFVEEVEFVDLFRSEQVGAGKKVVTFRMKLRRVNTTLTKAQANEVRDLLVGALARDVGATLRG